MPNTQETQSITKAALKAALELACDKPWSDLTLIEIAKHAGIAMSDLYSLADKETLSDALEAWADEDMSAEAADMEDTPRERLFDVIMRRFEKMEAYRKGILSIMRVRDRSPARMANLLKARRASAKWALSCAGLDNGASTSQAAKTIGIAWVIGKTERAWRKDESGDFARTMATLDAELTLAEERLGRFERFTGTAPKTANTAKPEATSSPEAPPAESDEA